MQVQIKTITTDDANLDKIESDLIDQVEKLAEAVELTEEEKEDAEQDKEAMSLMKFDKLYETLPTIQIPDNASYIEDDYRPWAVFYEVEKEGEYFHQVTYLEIN